MGSVAIEFLPAIDAALGRGFDAAGCDAKQQWTRRDFASNLVVTCMDFLIGGLAILPGCPSYSATCLVLHMSSRWTLSTLYVCRVSVDCKCLIHMTCLLGNTALAIGKSDHQE